MTLESNIKEIPFSILGIDLKEDVISKLNEIVVENKMQDISFIHGDISAYNQEVDIAIGLHACDISTDIFLSSAAKNEAKLIISVPCCQHQLNK